LQPQPPTAERAVEIVGTERALLGIPGLDCINDFIQYLTDPLIRGKVMDRFFRVVSPLLRDGAEIEIISHSWGTVVAYESLCRLGSVSPQPPAAVPTPSRVGAALSIGETRRRRMDVALEAHRPRMVRRWVNIDARGDMVGGLLKGLPSAVDAEFLTLPAVE